jgi:SAM-dependent methyltransferase
MTNQKSYYEQHAREYFESTIDIDVGGLRERFLQYVSRPGRILDAGSGSGRDTLAFLRLGYEVEAFDSSVALAALSTSFTGVRTRVCTFEEFEDFARFDGIWACASLLHVATKSLPDALSRLANALKPGGVLYTSFKQGEGERDSPDGRRFTNMTLPALQSLLNSLDEMRIREVWAYTGESASGEGEIWINAIATRQLDGSGR